MKNGFTDKSLNDLEMLESFVNSLQVTKPKPKHPDECINVTLPCIEGWKLNISGLRALWQDLKNFDFKYL